VDHQHVVADTTIQKTACHYTKGTQTL
jgi:hypothetical protein